MLHIVSLEVTFAFFISGNLKVVQPVQYSASH